MRIIRRHGYTVAALLGLVAMVQTAAADQPGFYLRADLGRGFPENSSFAIPDTYTTFHLDGGTYGKTRMASFPWLNAGLGYNTGQGLRVDGNISYFSTSLSGRGTYTAFTSVGILKPERWLPPTSLDALSGMVNGYAELADIFPAAFGYVRPYFGGGLGIARIDLGAVHAGSPNFPEGTRSFSQTNFAWDAVAGIGIPLSDRVTADIMYAYTDLGRVEGGGSSTQRSGGESFGPFRTDLSYHRVSLGLRVALGPGNAENQADEPVAGKPRGFYVRGDLGAGILPRGHYTYSTTDNLRVPTTWAADDKFNQQSFTLPSIGFGYDTGRGVRLDETLSYFSTTLSGWSALQGSSGRIGQFASGLNVLAAMSNAYVEFADLYPETFGLVRPYVGAGIGLARHQVASSTFTDSPSILLGGATGTRFAWDVAAGIEVPLTGRWMADLMYSYLDLGQVEGRAFITPWGTELSYTTSPLRADLSVHRVSMGLRYSF